MLHTFSSRRSRFSILLFSLALIIAAGTNAAGFSFIDSVKGFFGITVSHNDTSRTLRAQQEPSSGQTVTTPTVTERTINFAVLAAYEAAHLDILKFCQTCHRNKEEQEEKGEMNTFSLGPLPFPAKAKIKMSEPLPERAPAGITVPNAPSRAPVQQWLGQLDVGTIIPPSTHGAVGLNHVVTATNNFIKIHAKIGGAQISQVTISAFTGVASTCEPQMFFDPTTQRYIFAAIGCAGVNNPTILMASNTSDPTGTWRTITFVSFPGGLLDGPYLGYDDTKIVIGGLKFAGGTSFTGPDLYLIDKAAMLAGTPITFGVNAQSIVMSAVEGGSPRPVTVYFPPFANSGNPTPGTVYIVQSWNNTSLRLTTITGNIPACVWNTGAGVFPTAPAPEAWTSGSHGNTGSVQQQPPETRRLSSNDSRVSSAVMMNGEIWAVQHCAFPAGASGVSVTHTDVQYWQLEGTAGGTFGNVIQRGRSGAVPGEHRWFGSIAVNKNEDVLVGYSMSNNTTLWPSAGYSTRQATTPVNTLDDPLNFHNGESRYWKDFGSGRPRWGDYSQSHLDPVDNSLWTIQEYASTGAGAIPPDNNSRWGTWWAQVPASSVGPLISGTVTYGNAIGNPVPPRFVRNVSVASTVGSPTVGPVITGTPGTYTLTGFGAGSYTIKPTKPGGANVAISSADAARVAQGVSGSVPFVSDNQRFAADTSGNGAVSSTDASKIAQFVTGLPFSPPNFTGQWRFFTSNLPAFPAGAHPQERTYASVTSSVTGEDYIGLLIGETTGNYNPASHARPVGSRQLAVGSGPERGVAVELPQIAVSTDKEIVIPVSVEGAADKKIFSYEFDLRYDPTVIQPLENPVDVAGTVSRGLMVVTNPYEPGLLRVVVYGAFPIDENGVLLNLRFVAVSGSGAVSPLTWERIMFNEGEPRVNVVDGRVEISY